LKQFRKNMFLALFDAEEEEEDNTIHHNTMCYSPIFQKT